MTNPAFVPAPEDLTRLLERIEKLPGGGSEAGLWNGSGYRGFYVLINPQKVIRVYRDTIEIRTWTTEPKGSTAAYKRDETGAIEDELAKLLKKSGLAYGTHVDRDIESREDKRVLQQRVKR